MSHMVVVGAVFSFLMFQDATWSLYLMAISFGVANIEASSSHLQALRKSIVSGDDDGGGWYEPSRTLDTSCPSPCFPSEAINGGESSWLPPSVWWTRVSLLAAINFSISDLSVC